MIEPGARLRELRFGVFVIALPDPLLSMVAALRERFDPTSAASAPPHITVTQPLAEEPNDIGRADLGALLADYEPFEVTVGPARAFAGSPVVYLAVQPAAPILAIRDTAHATRLFRTELPHTDDFVPHVTVREWPHAEIGADNPAVIAAADAAIPPTRVRCTTIELWRPDPTGMFRAVDRIAFVGR
jgi:2'-5' RNA ligase